MVYLKMSRIPYSIIMFCSLCVFALASGCNNETALVVSEPFVEATGNWGLNNGLFELRSLLNGINIIHADTREDYTLSDILSDLENTPDFIILSPLNAKEALSLSVDIRKVIIAGGLPLPQSPENTIGLTMDTTQGYTEIGSMAGKIAVDEKKPAIILYRGNIDAIKESYAERSENSYPIMEFKISTPYPETPLPEGFVEQSNRASVILLFAGPMNPKAYLETQEGGLPVFTELAFSHGTWSDRILASVESDKRGFKKALLSIMAGDTQESIIYYPSKLEK